VRELFREQSRIVLVAFLARSLTSDPMSNRLMRLRHALALLSIATTGCASTGASPSMRVAVARGIQILPSTAQGCPGDARDAVYDASLSDGSFLHLTDDDLSGLVRTGVAAQPAGSGGWRLSKDPLESAMSGFRLTAVSRIDTTVHGDTLLRPRYDCLHSV